MEKYIILKEIGSGSFGKVYIVEQKASGIQYVTKQINLTRLNKRQKSLAEKEIQVLSKLKHNNIVGYKEAYLDEINLHIVMELCEMGDLHCKIQEARLSNTQFSEAEIMEYFVQICLALEYIHGLRILHRDIKTKNIFLTKKNIIKLGDFGVAKMLEDSFELARTCIGSPFYISPEICENQPYDKKSDIWALGCVLYEIATLKYAFTAKNMKLLFAKISTGECNPLPPEFNSKIKTIIKKLLKPNPRERPSSSEILIIPFVSEHRRKLMNKPKIMGRVIRSRSGEDLRKIMPDFRYKTSKTMLPISKSSLNLTSVSNGITNPESKYKTSNMSKVRTKPNGSKSAKLSPLNNEVGLVKEQKQKNLEGPKIRKLKKVDSLYYNMVEAESNSQSEAKSVAMIRNIFYDRNNDETQKASNKLFTTETEEETNIKEEQKQETKDNQTVNMAERPRSRWQISTADKNNLISFLNDVELESSDCELINSTIMAQDFKAKKNLSVDDMLSIGTTDLSHLQVLQPDIVKSSSLIYKKNRDSDFEHNTCTDDEPDLINLDTLTFGDKTYILTQQSRGQRIENKTDFELLEQRRITLENHFGIELFKTIYRKLESIFYRDRSVNDWGHGTETYTIVDLDALGVSISDKRWIQNVWELVIDDYVFSQQ